MQAISRYRVCSSGGPNFGFDLCCQRITEEEKATLDLSSWRNAFNGSEPIHAATIARFTKAFASCGFRPEFIQPCYGMAEASLMIAGKPSGQLPVMMDVEAAAMALGTARQVPSGTGRTAVSSGKACPGVTLQIVAPTSGQVLPDGTVGEIWTAGPNIGSGYWNKPDLSKEIFQATLSAFPGMQFLRTGDLGYFNAGELFVTGRLKDLIIVRGHNHYPQDLERTVQESHPALRAHGVAAFSIEDPTGEQLVIVQEVGAHGVASA